LRALSLLQAHGYCVALNSTRTLGEVQAYCRAYGCAGGIAEYGSVVWDEAQGRARTLVSSEAKDELHRLGQALRRVPGVFVDQRYEYALRAYTYDAEGTVCLPSGLAQGMMADAGLERLVVRQAPGDTSVHAREVDTGRALHALLALSGQDAAETIAIADAEADLALVSVAGRAYVSGCLARRSVTRLLGWHVAGRSAHPEPLRFARAIVHPRRARCPRCDGRPRRPEEGGLFWGLLEAADRTPLASLVRALADPMSLRTFVR
jgi:hypothetical protein